MMDTAKFIQPIDISQIKPILNGNCISEWQVFVTFDKKQEEPLRASGGYVFNKEIVAGNNLLVEYRFRESVMRRGAEHAILFSNYVSSKIAEYKRTLAK